MKQTSFKRLLPKEFDAALLEKLVREGRVYVNYPQVINKDAYKREVLDYVRTINDFVTDEWRDGIDDLWQEIVEAECFRNCLSMKRGLQAGHKNRYAITNIVYIMQNKGVYRNDVSMLTLHLNLEKTTQRNKYYSSCSSYYYCISCEAKKLLKQLLKRV